MPEIDHNAVEAVVFDFGGVMTTTTMPERVRPLVRALGIDWGVLEKGFAAYRRLMDGGFIDMKTMYSLIWADNNVSISPEDEAKIVDEDMASYCYRNEATLAYMRELKAKGFKIGILTNMPMEFVPRFRKYFADFIELADAMVISGEEHMFKPQRQIYELLRSRIGVEASKLLFFDDVEANCEAARKAGWQAIQFVR